MKRGLGMRPSAPSLSPRIIRHWLGIVSQLSCPAVKVVTRGKGGGLLAPSLESTTQCIVEVSTP